MRALLLGGCAAWLCACVPLAWQADSPVDAGSARDGGRSLGGGGGAGGGISGFGGGFFTGGGMPGVGGGAGGGPRPAEPIVTGAFLPFGANFLRGPLRSSPLATVAGTSNLVAVVDDADFLYVLGNPNRRIALPAGGRPSSVAVAPDGLTAWVALRGLGSVVRVTLATGALQQVSVGAEPTGVALSPTGRLAVVATFGERSVTLVDTQSLGFTVVDVGGHPRALTLTDDGDAEDADESAWVTLFFGEPLAEASDTGRRGVVVEVNLGTKAVVSRVTLAPLSTGAGQCSPNQLNAITQNGGSLYVTHVCASPAAPQGPRDAVFGGLSVITLATRTEDRSATGSTVLRGMMPPAEFLANPVDVVPFPGLPTPNVLVLAQGANMLEVPGTPMFSRASVTPFYGASGPVTEDPAAGVPTAVLATGSTRVFVLDANGRRVLQFNNLAPMFFPLEIPFETLPPEGSQAYRERLGRRHFATAEGPWSAMSSMSCTSCHPDGLTDGLTWSFGAGPRQTLSLAGTFERGRLAWHRAQNWTANADEISDVEGLVRSTMGGSGVIFTAPDSGVPLSLDNGIVGPGGLARHDGLSASSRDLALAVGGTDWLDVEAWIANLPRPPASPWLDAVSVGRGRQLFALGGCAACHGGPQWTVSHVPYVPSFAKNGSAAGANGQPAVASGLRLTPRSGDALWNASLNTDTLQVAPESVMLNGMPATIGPERITCVLRDVGTFDRADPLEVKSSGQPAQGEKGFNPPSLLGLATSAPYLHHGQAKTLEALFTPRYRAHHEAASPGFLAAADGGVELDQVRDLSAFLESLDESTTPFAQPFGSDVCGAY